MNNTHKKRRDEDETNDVQIEIEKKGKEGRKMKQIKIKNARKERRHHTRGIHRLAGSQAARGGGVAP